MIADRIRLDRPASGLQRFEGRFGGHVYDLHRHKTCGIGLTLGGVQQFHYRGRLRASGARQLLVLHPDEAHGGPAGEGATFAYRMRFLDPAAVSAALDGASRPHIAEAVAVDATIGRLADLLTRCGDGGPRRRQGCVALRAVIRARDFLAAEQPPRALPTRAI